MGVDFGRGAAFDPTLDELALLAESAGDTPVARVVARRQAPDAALFVGSGKADEIKLLVQAHEARTVLFDQAISPAQQRNLERVLGVPVADRTALILEIFAARAKSHEGKLQVELARLQYLATRLVRRWSHLERQSGGIGMRGGPGEAQIELDRRMIDERIKVTKERLKKVQRQRSTQRRARERNAVFKVSLVGYTNAGKSTLFNALVKARSYAANQLFATLDTTTRSLYLEEAGQSVSLSDTVGFIRDLPHKLVEAFKATLQEAAEADLLLHVVDAASPQLDEQMLEVERVAGRDRRRGDSADPGLQQAGPAGGEPATTRSDGLAGAFRRCAGAARFCLGRAGQRTGRVARPDRRSHARAGAGGTELELRRIGATCAGRVVNPFS